MSEEKRMPGLLEYARAQASQLQPRSHAPGLGFLYGFLSFFVSGAAGIGAESWLWFVGLATLLIGLVMLSDWPGFRRAVLIGFFGPVVAIVLVLATCAVVFR